MFFTKETGLAFGILAIGNGKVSDNEIGGFGFKGRGFRTRAGSFESEILLGVGSS